MSQDESIQGRYLRFYTLLCQLIVAIITFYCAIAISRYDPTPSVPELYAITPPTPFSNANSTTADICKTDDLDATLVAITPYSVLCPSMDFSLLSLMSFVFGIYIFNYLNTEDIDYVEGYSCFIVADVLSLDWDNALVSLRITMPIVIWIATMLLPIGHWLFKTFVPGIYWRYRRAMRSQREALWKTTACRGEIVGDVERGEEAVEGRAVEERINEETPLMRDQRRDESGGRISC